MEVVRHIAIPLPCHKLELDLCLKDNTDFITNLVGPRTQISVSYSSAFLVPSWQLLTLCLYAGPVAWIMLFLIRQLTFLRVGT